MTPTTRLLVESGLVPLSKRELHRCDASFKPTERLAVSPPMRALSMEALDDLSRFYPDESFDHPLFEVRHDERLHRGLAPQDEIVLDGKTVARCDKDFARSLGRSTWHLHTDDGVELTGRERDRRKAFGRRYAPPILPAGVRHALDLVSRGDMDFDFVTPDGQPVLTVSDRSISLKARIGVELQPLPDGRELDWRLAAGVAVAVHASVMLEGSLRGRRRR